MSNEEIVLAYQTCQDDQERKDLTGALYAQNTGLIGKVVCKYIGAAEEDDLKQEAFFGLVEAADRWTPDGGASFAVYAVYWIRQAMVRYIENTQNGIRISGPRRQQILHYLRYCAEYEKLYGRKPSDYDLMEELQLNYEHLNALRKDREFLRIRSLSEPIPGEDPELTLSDVIQDPEDPTDDVIEDLQHRRLSATIWKMVDDLEDSQAEVIRQRYRSNKSLKECAAEMDLPAASVSQLEKKALRRLSHRRNMEILMPFLEDKAVSLGYGASGLEAFKRTGSSSVERAVIAAEDAARGRRFGK